MTAAAKAVLLLCAIALLAAGSGAADSDSEPGFPDHEPHSDFAQFEGTGTVQNGPRLPTSHRACLC